MDKQTLSNYGLLTVVTLILAVMLAFTTPFGTYVGDGVVSVANGFVGASDKGLDEDNISGLEKQWGDKLNTNVRNGIIPIGATYTPNGGTAITGNGTNTFPDTPQTGDAYKEGSYIYKYNQYFDSGSWKSDTSQNGWDIRVNDVSKTSYGEIVSEIAGQPVNTMSQTFYGYTSLTTAPAIPSTVTNMYDTFAHCTSLTAAPAIPSSVTNMNQTFAQCTSLTGTIEVNANPNSYTNCLKSTQITAITGSCSQATKNALMATK